MEWQPIETMPKGRVELMFWIRPKTNDELTAQWKKLVIQSSTREPCLSMGIYGQWSSLFTATHWMPLPAPPTGA